MGNVTVDWWLQAAIILGMFILRLGVPLVITLAIGAWLRRLDAKWRAEALAQQQVRPLVGKADRAQRPVEVEPKTEEPVKARDKPCWILKNCPETIRSRCPAFQHPEIPCWLARRQAEGRLPATCYGCELFSWPA